MKKCLIYLEPGYETYAVDLLEIAETIYCASFTGAALSVNADPEAAMGEFDIVFSVEKPEIQECDTKNIVNIMEELQNWQAFDSILILATHFGRMLAPRLAMRFGVGLVADVTEVSRFGDSIEMVRPAFDGKLMAGITNSGGKPVMMSVRPGVFIHQASGKKKTARLGYATQNIQDSGIRRLERKGKPETKDIRESRVLIAGGGGIINDFDNIGRLAERLGGMKAASRKVVDSGKADRNIQVGQSGKVVSPDLYIALGIYGSLQHIAGLNRVKHLIAVNTNRNAPICSLADIVVEGDACEFIEKLTAKIDKER